MKNASQNTQPNISHYFQNGKTPTKESYTQCWSDYIAKAIKKHEETKP